MNVGIDPSKVIITKFKLDKDRKALLDRKGLQMRMWPHLCRRLTRSCSLEKSKRFGKQIHRIGFHICAGLNAIPRNCTW